MDAMSALQTPVHFYSSECASSGSHALLTKRCFLFAGNGRACTVAAALPDPAWENLLWHFRCT